MWTEMNVNSVGRRASMLSQLSNWHSLSFSRIISPVLYNVGCNIHLSCSKQCKYELKLNACWLCMTKHALTAGSFNFHHLFWFPFYSFVGILSSRLYFVITQIFFLLPWWSAGEEYASYRWGNFNPFYMPILGFLVGTIISPLKQIED